MTNLIAAVGRKFTDYYNTSYIDAQKSFKKLARKSRLKSKNIDFEIKYLLYFSFDFGIASGPEAEIRNQIRDYFIAFLKFPESTLDLIEQRVMEYTNAFKSENDNTQRLLSVGNVFATHTGNAYDILVNTWVTKIFVNNYKFACDSTSMLVSDMDEMDNNE